jgi:hypothetical protein
MSILKRAGEVLPLLLEFKDAIIKETESSGKIRLSEELFNVTLKKIILSKLEKIDDYTCDFYSGEITITKSIILFPMNLKLHSLSFILSNEEYKLIAKHKHSNVFGLVQFFGAMPSFMSATKEQIEMDFSKIDSFQKLKNEGFFGIDLIKTTQIQFLSCENGFLTFSYKFI